MRKFALGVQDRRRDEHRTINDRRRSCGYRKGDRNRGDSVPLLRQDDPVSVVVRGDKLDDVISGHPVTVGRKAGTHWSDEQEAGQQPFG